VGGRVPVVAGTGANSTREAVKLTVEAKEVGAQYSLQVVPYYNKPTQEGMYRYFKAIAEAADKPIVLYNVPGRTGVNLLPETVMRIYNARPDKILGIKEASGNLDQIKHLISLSAESGLLVISGDDGIACDVMEAGGAGLISVASNAFPEDFMRIVHNKDRGLQDKYAETIRLLFAEGNPTGIKALLANHGVIQNYLRLPLVPASPKLQAQLK